MSELHTRAMMLHMGIQSLVQTRGLADDPEALKAIEYALVSGLVIGPFPCSRESRSEDGGPGPLMDALLRRVSQLERGGEDAPVKGDA